MVSQGSGTVALCQILPAQSTAEVWAPEEGRAGLRAEEGGWS